MNVPKKVLYSVFGSKPEDWKQHANGGGWVYKTAKVESTVYLHQTSIVFGNAQVSGDARVFGDAWEDSPLYIQGSRHALTLCSHTQIAVDCHVHDISKWLERYKAIGESEGYTKEQIAEYGIYLTLLADTAKRLQAKKTKP